MTLRIYAVSLEMIRDVARLAPAIERHDGDLGRQLRRAATSVPLNLSEGMYSRGKNRLGGSIRPFESVELLHKLEVGLYGYYYRKAVASELISDSRAFLNSADVGKEIDIFLRWRIFSDLGFYVNYGCFFPGKAYQDDSPRNFVSAGITYSF